MDGMEEVVEGVFERVLVVILKMSF